MDASVKDIEDYLKTCGKVMSCEVDNDTGKCFVEMESRDEYARALKFISTNEFQETKLKVAQQLQDNSPIKSECRSRSRSASPNNGAENHEASRSRSPAHSSRSSSPGKPANGTNGDAHEDSDSKSDDSNSKDPANSASVESDQ